MGMPSTKKSKVTGAARLPLPFVAKQFGAGAGRVLTGVLQIPKRTDDLLLESDDIGLP